MAAEVTKLAIALAQFVSRTFLNPRGLADAVHKAEVHYCTRGD